MHSPTTHIDQPDTRRALKTIAVALLLFTLNGWICLRLFNVDFYNNMNSVEGLFIGITQYTMHHWGDLTWVPLWYTGMPFHQLYPPGIHVTGAALAELMHWSPVHAWHFLVAFLYCLGPSALFWTAWTLTDRFGAAIAAGLLWSLFSPACVLIPSVYHETGEIISNRRLHNIVSSGEGPNAVTLGLVVLCVGLIHLALVRGRPVHYLGAVLTGASVALCSWPAAAALVMALVCYVLSREPIEWMRILARLLIIGGFAYALAAPWIPPSTVLFTIARTGTMDGSPLPNPWRSVAIIALLALMGFLWWMFQRFGLPFWLRFAAFYFTITGYITLIDKYGGPSLITQAYRFQLAMEIGFILTLTFGVSLLFKGRPSAQHAVWALLLVFCVRQAIVSRRHARAELAPIPVETTVEYQTAKWLEKNIPGDRVFAAGSVEFWLDAFSETPQLKGCCDQANTNVMNDIAIYTIHAWSGDTPNWSNAAIRILWMKAMGVHAIAFGGPGSREAYNAIARPETLIESLPVAWRNGNDYICMVPARSGSIAHVMRLSDVSDRLPRIGLDAEPVLKYVTAMEDPHYPIVGIHWLNQHTIHFAVELQRSQIISLQMAFWPGWRATANGRSVPVRRDGFGFLYVEPQCSGHCEIELGYDSGIEPILLRWIWGIAMAGGVSLLAFMQWRKASNRGCQ